MAYQRHDINCDQAPAPLPYTRHDTNCDPAVDLPENLADKDPSVVYKPSYTEATDEYGNTYRNYNLSLIHI